MDDDNDKKVAPRYFEVQSKLLKWCQQEQGTVGKNFSHPSGSKWKPSKTGFIMGNEFEKNNDIISNFLELLGFDELIGFKSSMEEECHDIDKASFWYRRRIGSKMMGFKAKTALMIATMFESKAVLNYILETSFIDVNQASGLDGFLHFICCCC